MEEVNATGKSKGLRGFEMLRAVHLESTEFAVENDLMTPSFKVRTHPISTANPPCVKAEQAATGLVDDHWAAADLMLTGPSQRNAVCIGSDML